MNQTFTTHVVGLGQPDSDRLLRYLFLQAHTPEYQVRFRWTATPWRSGTTAPPRTTP